MVGLVPSETAAAIKELPEVINRGETTKPVNRGRELLNYVLKALTGDQSRLKPDERVAKAPTQSPSDRATVSSNADLPPKVSQHS